MKKKFWLQFNFLCYFLQFQVISGLKKHPLLRVRLNRISVIRIIVELDCVSMFSNSDSIYDSFTNPLSHVSCKFKVTMRSQSWQLLAQARAPWTYMHVILLWINVQRLIERVEHLRGVIDETLFNRRSVLFGSCFEMYIKIVALKRCAWWIQFCQAVLCRCKHLLSGISLERRSTNF